MPMIRYKINVLQALKDAGYNTNTIRKEKLIPEATMNLLRHDKPVAFSTLDTICRLLQCQPGDIIEYSEDETVE